MNSYRLITEHKMTVESRPVTRHSSSWNMDYEDHDRYLVCECGYEHRLIALLSSQDQEERMLAIEHSITVLGDAIWRTESFKGETSE